MTKMLTKKVLLNLKTLAITVFLFGAIVFMAGCSQFGGSKGSTIPEVYSGTRGFEVAFAAESVPNVMSEGSSSEVVLLISNNGALDADLSSAILALRDTKDVVGFDKPVLAGNEIIDRINKNKEEKIGKDFAGKAKNVVGSLESITATVTARSLVKGSDAVSTGLLATACYKYKTDLTANVCIDAAPYSFQKQRKPCDAKLPLSFQSQGAPVAVKKIETLVPDKSSGVVRPKFKIYFANVGNGLVIDKTDDSLKVFCTDTKVKDFDAAKAIGSVSIDNVELNGKKLGSGMECNFRDEKGQGIKLTGSLDNDFVLCTYTASDFADGSGVFATPLKVEVSYGYSSTSNPVPVRVEKVIQCSEGAERSCTTAQGSGTQKCISGHWTFCQK